jgi:hypothetical protein
MESDEGKAFDVSPRTLWPVQPLQAAFPKENVILLRYRTIGAKNLGRLYSKIE